MDWIRERLIEAGVDPSNIFVEGFKKGMSIILILIAMKVLIGISNRVIRKFFETKEIGKFSMEERRANTLSTILRSVIRYIVYFIGILTIAGQFVDVTSLIAVAGVGSLAIGFGAQSLVKDVVTGFFIFFEDQYSVGDYISAGSFSGIVEAMGLRTTQIRDFNGDLHIVPNGEIITVTNHSRGNMRAMIDVAIAYGEDIQRALDILNDLCHQLAQENDSIVEGPYVLGVQDLGESSVNIRIIAQTMNMEQWTVERMLRQRIKETFDREGIQAPYPRRVVHHQTLEEK